MAHCIPSHEVPSKSQSPWLSRGLLKLIHKKNELYTKARRLVGVSTHVWSKYKAIRNDVVARIRSAKSHYLERCSFAINDHKKFWSLSRKITKNRQPIPAAVTHNSSEPATTPKAQANLFNRFFVSCFSSISPLLKYPPPSPAATLSTITCSEREVLAQLSSLKENKATGPDGISATMLRRTASCIAPALTILFNQSLSTGVFPKCWKTSNVVPIHKKDSRSSVSNYRPISLLSIVSKVFERVVFNHLMSHLIEHGILSDIHFGFRPQRSAQDALLCATRDWHLSLDSGNSVSAVFFDLAKAFDSVPHEGVLACLKSSGITGPLLTWFKSYLTDRTQQVVIQGHTSEPLPVSSGVPQGSILGPLLFILYMNSISTLCLFNSSKLVLFADDILLYKITNSPHDMQCLQSDINKICDWTAKTGLKLNVNKTKFMIISRKRFPPSAHLTINNTPLEQVLNYKYLGVVISSKLQWNDHIHYISSKARKRLGFMYRNLQNASIAAKLHLYKSSVLPILDYCCCVWAPHHTNLIEELESVQHLAFKIISNNWSCSVSNLMSLPFFKSISPLTVRRSYFLVLNVQRIITGRSPLLSSFEFSSPSATRSSDEYKLIEPHVQTLSHQSSFFIKGIKLWNSLPSDIASVYTSKNFKLILKHHFLKT